MWLPFFVTQPPCLRVLSPDVFVYSLDMSSAENKKIVETAFMAWSKGDGMAVFNLIADQVEWTITGSSPISGTYTSKHDFIEKALKPQREHLTGPPVAQVHAVLAEDDWVVVQWEGRATTKTGMPYNNQYCYVLKVIDGTIVRGTTYWDTELVNRAWRE